MLLENKSSIVTGAGRGIGKAIAIGMAKEGASVVIADILAEEASTVASEIRSAGGSAITVQGDLTDQIARTEVVDRTIQEYGRIDVLVNCAGVVSWHSIMDSTEHEWARMMNINAKMPFFLAVEVARLMARGGGGAVINLCSVAGIKAARGLSIYGISKAAVCMATKQLALELAPLGIRVNGILPGTTETDMNREHLSEPGVMQAEIAAVPLGRLGVPDDIVGATVFLASDAASWITGALLPIDGGVLIG